jgi:hypothetical protein
VADGFCIVIVNGHVAPLEANSWIFAPSGAQLP